MTDLHTRLADFATLTIATRPELMESEAFPLDIWRGLGEAGLMGLAVDQAFGGLGLSFSDLSKAAETFAAHAACPGMAMSWLAHNLMGRLLIEGVGTQDQKEAWLPKIASGTCTVAVAISEPGAGAHPKFLTGTARRQEASGGWVINAEKAFVTNGPIAGLFVVLAITGEADGRKAFSAFAVPAASPGITLLPMDKPRIDFLKPAPHAIIRFENVTVPQDALLGAEGEGFDVVSKRVRAVEDAVGLGSTAGNLRAHLGLLADCLSTDQREADEVTLFFGKMLPRLEGLSTLANEAARAVDDGRRPTVGGAAGALMAEAEEAIRRFVADNDIATTHAFDLFTRDMEKSGNIARRARDLAAQKAGRAWLARVSPGS